jgi:probable HAF family extracellular repeat protein
VVTFYLCKLAVVQTYKKRRAMREKSILLLTAILLYSRLVSVSSAAVPSFQGLGDLPGNKFYSEAYGISSDGQVVVGESKSLESDETEAFIWTTSGGMVGLGDFPGRELSSEARAASADGSVVVGSGKPDWPGYEAFRWTQSGGMVGIGHLGAEDSGAMDVSSDGSVVVGCGISPSGPVEAFRWTESSGMVGLGFLPGGGSYPYSIAMGVSADGSVVVGIDDSTGSYEAFRWTEDSGMTALAPGLHHFSQAKGISDDGLVIVGNYFNKYESFAFRWTAEDGMVGLGEIPGHTTTYSAAYAASADGSVIVGGNDNNWFGPYSGDESFIWSEIYGMRNLQDMLENNCGLDLSGWTLISATGISADGLSIVGIGINPDGYTEAWIATIPEPATLFLLGLGSLAMLRKRRK